MSRAEILNLLQKQVNAGGCGDMPCMMPHAGALVGGDGGIFTRKSAKGLKEYQAFRAAHPGLPREELSELWACHKMRAGAAPKRRAKGSALVGGEFGKAARCGLLEYQSFRAAHPGLPRSELSALWQSHKRGGALVGGALVGGFPGQRKIFARIRDRNRGATRSRLHDLFEREREKYKLKEKKARAEARATGVRRPKKKGTEMVRLKSRCEVLCERHPELVAAFKKMLAAVNAAPPAEKAAASAVMASPEAAVAPVEAAKTVMESIPAAPHMPEALGHERAALSGSLIGDITKEAQARLSLSKEEKIARDLARESARAAKEAAKKAAKAQMASEKAVAAEMVAAQVPSAANIEAAEHHAVVAEEKAAEAEVAAEQADEVAEMAEQAADAAEIAVEREAVAAEPVDLFADLFAPGFAEALSAASPAVLGTGIRRRRKAAPLTLSQCRAMFPKARAKPKAKKYSPEIIKAAKAFGKLKRDDPAFARSLGLGMYAY